MIYLVVHERVNTQVILASYLTIDLVVHESLIEVEEEESRRRTKMKDRNGKKFFTMT